MTTQAQRLRRAEQGSSRLSRLLRQQQETLVKVSRDDLPQTRRRSEEKLETALRKAAKVEQTDEEE